MTALAETPTKVSPRTPAAAPVIEKFNAQLFGGRWDGQWFELAALPERLVVPDQDDRNLYYVRSNWSPVEYQIAGYMRYNLQDGGYYGHPYRRVHE